MFISLGNLVLVGGESNTRASITVSLETEHISAITDMATARGIGFSAMAAILLTQGRARVAEMDSRHGSAMEHRNHAEQGKGTDSLRQGVGTKRSRENKKTRAK